MFQSCDERLTLISTEWWLTCNLIINLLVSNVEGKKSQNIDLIIIHFVLNYYYLGKIFITD